MHSSSLNDCFVGSDSFYFSFDSINMHLAIRQLKRFPKIQGQSCAPPVTFVKSSRLAGASLKSHRRQDKLSSMFHLAALHQSLKSSCSICNQQLPKLNKVFPFFLSTL